MSNVPLALANWWRRWRSRSPLLRQRSNQDTFSIPKLARLGPAGPSSSFEGVIVFTSQHISAMLGAGIAMKRSVVSPSNVERVQRVKHWTPELWVVIPSEQLRVCLPRFGECSPARHQSAPTHRLSAGRTANRGRYI